MKSRATYAAIWVGAVVLATVVALAVIETVGDEVRGQGPLGEENPGDTGLVRVAEPDPDAATVQREVGGDYGTFVVACQGVYATGEDAYADAGEGWRVARFEPGPDDDVAAVFANRRSVVEIEVFCNGGRPTLAEVERSRRGSDD